MQKFREYTTRSTVTSTNLQPKKSVVQIVHMGIRTNLNIYMATKKQEHVDVKPDKLEKPVTTVARDVFVNKTGTSQGCENI